MSVSGFWNQIVFVFAPLCYCLFKMSADEEDQLFRLWRTRLTVMQVGSLCVCMSIWILYMCGEQWREVRNCAAKERQLLVVVAPRGFASAKLRATGNQVFLKP
jgi:hypothetical protein